MLGCLLSKPEHECVELLWENGRIVMQGISNRTKKASFPTTFPSTSGKAQEKEVGHTVSTLKAGRYKAIGSVGNGFQTTVPSRQTRKNNQQDDMVPWLNDPIEDYYLSNVSGTDLNSLSRTVPDDKVASYGQAETGTRGLQNASTSRVPAGCSEPNRMRNRQLFQFQQQCLTSFPSNRPKDSELRMGATDQCRNGDLPIKMQKQDLTSSKPIQPSSSATLMNFSHFARPAAPVKSNLQCVDRTSGNEKACAPSSSNAVESKLIKSANGLKSFPAFHGKMTSVTPKADLNLSAQAALETVSLQHSEPICQEDAGKNSSNHNDINTTTNLRLPFHGSSFTASAVAGKRRTEKPPEPVTASPSMCSANGAGATSNDVKNRVKRKCQQGEESECQSEDLEDDSVGTRKPVTGRGTSTKRGRAAEVHNLSERRRGDRINEKIRALQKLIPNCTKVDKGSMLDEAIEYLKTLQMQVQIMSMYSGLHMMPMMLPSGMQHIHPSHVGPFAPIGVNMGMGMGLGFGMGMLEMTGSYMLPVPHMHTPLYPSGSISGTAGLHGIPGSTNPQMFGIPGQALSMSMPHPPPLTPLTGWSMKVNPAPEVPGTEVSSEQPMDSGPSNSKNQQLQTLEPVGETSANKPQVERSRQGNKECFEHPSLVQIGNQPPNIDGNEPINKETELG